MVRQEIVRSSLLSFSQGPSPDASSRRWGVRGENRVREGRGLVEVRWFGVGRQGFAD